MKIGLIQSSLNPKSKTAMLLEQCKHVIEEFGISFERIDLREYTLPYCDGSTREDYNNKDLDMLRDIVDECTHFIVGMPVYQYTFSGVLKNFLDLLGEPMKNKAFGIVEMSGSIRAYLAPTALINSLFFECSAIPVPPVVHGRAGDFDGDTITNIHIPQKIQELVKNLQRVG